MSFPLTILTMTRTTTHLTFQHSTLTQIVRMPTNSSIKLLTKEVYTNAHAIPSTHGGSVHSHLGLVMSHAEYTAVAGVNFQLPAHPGPAPIHATSANAAAHTETTCLYEATLKELSTATTIQEEIKKQILATIGRIYLAILDDNVFGFINVTV